MSETKKRVNFNDYVETYKKEVQSSISFIGQEHDFFVNVKANLIKEIADKNFNNPEDIHLLDIGSGIGLIDHQISSKFKNLYGVDIEESIVEKAKEYNLGVNYTFYDGKKLPFKDNSIDFVFTINVMHHIPPEYWEQFVKEMQRVTRKDGIAAIFEHNPLNPLTKLAVSKCELDRGAVLLTKRKLKSLFIQKFKLIDEAYILFFPLKNNIFRSIETILKWIPLGAQYYIYGRK